MTSSDVDAVARRVDSRLSRTPWDLSALETDEVAGEVSAATEVAIFALKLAGKRRQARRGGRFGRLVVSFALAACLALASVAAACEKPDASADDYAETLSQLPSDSGSTAGIANPPRAGPAQYTNMVLVDAGSDSQPWALLVPRGQDMPILADRVGAGLDRVGSAYALRAQPVAVGTRDGPAQFLDPLDSAEPMDVDAAAVPGRDQLLQSWGQDERFLAAARAIAGQPSVLDAAYNADAAATAGGTHTYANGIVLRQEPDKPVLHVIDRTLLESGAPTRAEDVVYVAINPSQASLYEPGQVVNLRDVVMEKQNTDVDGESTTVYVVNAALNGARVEQVGRVDLAGLLQPRLQRVEQDLAAQDQVEAASPQPTGTPAPVQQPVIVNQTNRGSSFVGDFLIWMWLTNSLFYRGPTVVVNNPAPVGGRSRDLYYSAPPATRGSSPSTIASSQAASRSTALEAARTSVSGQSSGTGGGVAATNKSAADASARVGAATSKSAAVAGSVSASSVGKSAPTSSSGSSSLASRSAGSTSAGSRGSAGVSSGSKGIGGTSGGFGGKGVGGSSSA